ncbi:hypothetical protein [Sphaerisporangium siamense]|uniref:Cell division septum initiation protein DivIVA n=1 Tax=Sphaerisporangium siamense TaxID=795645 RepID=A0A7W7D6N1_9ACTN|nr:hypothetical protein [Sphaerisporangium siamense]MBB4701235.1 cell division septum initiation protein DivIVA [Sphaerisporangium siamense]
MTRADHRQDVKDALWEVQALKRELAEVRREVGQLRKRVESAAAAPVKATDPALGAKVAETHRLASETASAVDHLLQADVLLWQAVEEIREGDRPAADGPAPRGDA